VSGRDHPAVARFRRATEKIARLEERRAELARERAAAITAMREAGMSWKEMEEATGVSQQRMDQIRRRETTK
jgi:uncharacterized protein (UPF0335 family)